jgi:hypothetical protein
MRHFTSEEVREFVCENVVETIYGENRRWLRTNTTIVKVGGKYYALWWEEGLTECQECEYPEQDANEVEKREKTIIVNDWIEIE